MTAFAATSPRLEDFLFAPVAEDRKGMRVSLLSGLSRLDLDPWLEARLLADMPQAEAAALLDALVLRMADMPSTAVEHGGIVARLMALLPREAAASVAPGPAAPTAEPTRTPVAIWIVIALAMIAAQVMTAPQAPDQPPTISAQPEDRAP